METKVINYVLSRTICGNPLCGHRERRLGMVITSPRLLLGDTLEEKDVGEVVSAA